MNDLTSSPAADAAPVETYDNLPLTAEVKRALSELGYVHPTPVQRAVLEPAAAGHNLVVQARTGTGKTCAFGLPIVDSLVRKQRDVVQALVLTPTRELALQVASEMRKLGQYRGVNVAAVYGGASMQQQIDELAKGPHVVVGTPGRVLDHLRRGTFDSQNVRIFVLDEADEMLSMGFARELSAIVERLPAERQGLFFSATIPPDIERMAREKLRDPQFVTLSSDQAGALTIEHFVYFVREKKLNALLEVIEVENPESAILFCNTKDETQRVAEALQNQGFEADWLNGDLEQKERERVMRATREGKLRFLVATDVAARGIDISHLTHVINYDFPESQENYVHRTGRTGRAGRTGTAISLVGPRDVGNVYLVRLSYGIRPIEKQLPTSGERKTRAEQDVVDGFFAAYGERPIDDEALAIAKRLLTHDDATQVVAHLVRALLGEKSDESKERAAEARRAKNPRPVPEEPARDEASAKAPKARERRSDLKERAGREGQERSARPRRSDRPTLDPAAPAAAEGEAHEPPRARDSEPVTAPLPERAREERKPRRSSRPQPERIEAELPSIGWTESEAAPSEAPAAALPEGEAVEPAPRTRRSDRSGRGERRPSIVVSEAAPLSSPPPREVSVEAPAHDATEAEAPSNSARLYLNAGKRDGLRREDLQNLFAPAGIEPLEAPMIRDRMTYIVVPRDLADSAIAALSGQLIGERTLVAEIARPRAPR